MCAKFCLELQFQTELYLAARRGVSDRAEVVGRLVDDKVVIVEVQVDMIERIEHVATELQLELFSNHESLAQREVPEVAPWSQNRTESGVAATIFRCRSECVCIEPL